jgi:lycopene beta-cyclase
MADADILILGGGCAGLSLAMRLAELGDKAPRTLILEARTAYANDRTWCFWENDAESMAFTASLVKQRWTNMRIRTGTAQVLAECAHAPYALLPSLVFYDYARDVISRSRRVKLCTGMPVSHVTQLANAKWHIKAGGRQYTAKTVIDTRPGATPERHTAMLWQSFSGVEIACETPVFDASFVDLMDFQHVDATRVMFTYVLPTSPRHALIETTVFGADPVTQADLKPDLERAIASRVGQAAYQILDTEHGILPMGQPRPPPYQSANFITVGLGAGAARPSTGYAFQRIQHWAKHCAQQISAGEPPSGHIRDPWRMRAMDNLFLRVIRTHPVRAPQLFLSLFQRADTASIIRFLSDGGTIADAMAVIRALPPLPFLTAGLTAMRDTVPAALVSVAAHLRGPVAR